MENPIKQTNNLRDLRREYFAGVDFCKALGKKATITEGEQRELEKRWTETKALKSRLDVLEAVEKSEVEKAPAPKPKERRSFSLMKVIRALGGEKLSGFEAEQVKELEKRGHTRPGAIPVPMEAFSSPLEQRAVIDSAAVTPELVKKSPRPELLIRGLYEKSVAISALGVRVLEASGPGRIPAVDAISSGFFSGSGEAAATGKLTESTPSFSEKEISPVYAGSYTSWSIDAIMESASTMDLESILRESLSMAMSTLVDKTILALAKPARGFGSLFSLLTPTVNNTAKTVSSSSKWSWTDFTALEEKFLNAFKNNAASVRILCTNKDRKLLKDTEKFAGTSGLSIWDSLPMPVSSSHCPDARLAMGDWSQYVLFRHSPPMLQLGMSGDSFLRGVTYLRIIQSFSSVLLRPEGFQQIVITRG